MASLIQICQKSPCFNNRENTGIHKIAMYLKVLHRECIIAFNIYCSNCTARQTRIIFLTT